MSEILFLTSDAKPFLSKVFSADLLDNHTLSEEVFGPLGLVVIAKNEDDMRKLARSLLPVL